MIFGTLFLIGLYASTASGQGFVCGFGLDAKEATGQTEQFHFQNPTFYRSGTIRPVILFGKFKGDEDPLVLTKLKNREGVER